MTKIAFSRKSYILENPGCYPKSYSNSLNFRIENNFKCYYSVKFRKEI